MPFGTCNIEDKKLKHVITLWSENYICDTSIWDNKENIILKLRKIETGIDTYTKITVTSLKSQNKTLQI